MVKFSRDICRRSAARSVKREEFIFTAPSNSAGCSLFEVTKPSDRSGMSRCSGSPSGEGETGS